MLYLNWFAEFLLQYLKIGSKIREFLAKGPVLGP